MSLFRDHAGCHLWVANFEYGTIIYYDDDIQYIGDYEWRNDLIEFKTYICLTKFKTQNLIFNWNNKNINESEFWNRLEKKAEN